MKKHNDHALAPLCAPRTYSPGTWYEGDRPCVANYPQFLMRLMRSGALNYGPRFRRTTRPSDFANRIKSLEIVMANNDEARMSAARKRMEDLYNAIIK